MINSTTNEFLTSAWDDSSFSASTTHTTTSGANVLVVRLCGNGIAPAGITYAGVALTQRVWQSDADSRGVGIYTLETPASGSNTLIVDAGATGKNYQVSIADITGFQAVNGTQVANGNVANQSVTVATAAGDFVLDVLSVDAVAATTRDTQLLNTNYASCSTFTASSTSTEMSWTHAANPTALAAISLSPTAASDTEIPTISSASTDGDTTTIVFNENVDVGNGGNGGFTVPATYGTVTLTPITTLPASTVEFTNSRAIENGETISGAYVQPSDGFEDEAGNDLASGTFAVTNNSKVHKLFSGLGQPYTATDVRVSVATLDGTDIAHTEVLTPDSDGYVRLTDTLTAGNYPAVVYSDDMSISASIRHIIE